MNIETKLIVSIDGEVIYQDTGFGENGLEHIVEKSHRIPQQINNYKILHQNMNVEFDKEEAEDQAVEIQVEESLLDKTENTFYTLAACVCRKCDAPLICDYLHNKGEEHQEGLCASCA